MKNNFLSGKHAWSCIKARECILSFFSSAELEWDAFAKRRHACQYSKEKPRKYWYHISKMHRGKDRKLARSSCQSYGKEVCLHSSPFFHKSKTCTGFSIKYDKFMRITINVMHSQICPWEKLLVRSYKFSSPQKPRNIEAKISTPRCQTFQQPHEWFISLWEYFRPWTWPTVDFRAFDSDSIWTKSWRCLLAVKTKKKRTTKIVDDLYCLEFILFWIKLKKTYSFFLLYARDAKNSPQIRVQ